MMTRRKLLLHGEGLKVKGKPKRRPLGHAQWRDGYEIPFYSHAQAKTLEGRLRCISVVVDAYEIVDVELDVLDGHLKWNFPEPPPDELLNRLIGMPSNQVVAGLMSHLRERYPNVYYLREADSRVRILHRHQEEEHQSLPPDHLVWASNARRVAADIIGEGGLTLGVDPSHEAR